jgi:hypothetical protein
MELSALSGCKRIAISLDLHFHSVTWTVVEVMYYFVTVDLQSPAANIVFLTVLFEFHATNFDIAALRLSL